jgi:hypothetical protein
VASIDAGIGAYQKNKEFPNEHHEIDDGSCKTAALIAGLSTGFTQQQGGAPARAFKP